MKKILISILLAAILLSCNDNSYTLRGKTNNPDLNGVNISIRIFDGKNWNDAGNVTVENQNFIYKGYIEEPAMAFLSFNDPEKQVRGNKAFILENAKIKFEIDEDMQIKMTGTDANNLLQSFEDNLNDIVPQEFVDSMQNNLLSELELEKRFEYYTGEHNKLIAAFAKKHVNTLPGTLIFLNTYYSMPLEDKIAVLDLMSDETKDNSQIQAIVMQTENEKRIAPGQQYSDFQLPDQNGKMLSLSDLVGKSDYLLVDFWASWCGPCIRSFPELTKFYNENNGKRFEILGVSLDDNEERWKSAIETHKLVWKHVSDLKGWQSEAGKLYAVSSIPCTILIDKQGTIIGRNMSLSEIAKLIK